MLIALLASLYGSAAFAAPGFIPVQGVLTDSSGVAVQGQVQVMFRIYPDATDATPFFSDELAIDAVDGRFAVRLGAGLLPLELSDFAVYPKATLTMQIAGDSETGRIPLDAVPYAAYALEARALEGVTLDEILEEIPTLDDVGAEAAAACFDNVGELTAALDGIYFSDLSELTAALSGTYFADEAELRAVLDAVYLSDESQLTALLDDNYLAAGYTPAWAAITDIPGGFVDGTDDGFTTANELTALLDAVYLPVSYVPSWDNLADIPDDFADGVDDGLDEDEVTAIVEDYIVAAGSPTWDTLPGVPSAFSDGVDDGFTTEGELTALLDDNYRPASYTPTWAEVSAKPAGFADGTDDGFTLESDLTALLDDNYRPATYVPGWADVTSKPAGFADGVDNGFTTEADLTALLNDNYRPATYVPSWADVTSKPAGFADGTDDGFTSEGQLTTLLNDNYKAAAYVPAWSEITSIPAGLSDGDDNTTYTAGAGLTLTGTTFGLNEYAYTNAIPNAQFGSGDLTGWTVDSGAGSVQTVTDGAAGSRVFRNTANTSAWVSSNTRIAVRPGQNYRVSGTYRRTDAAGTGGTIYLAVRAFDVDGNNIGGDGTWWYYPMNVAIANGDTAWRTYTYDFGPEFARTIPASAVTLSVGAILNYNNGNRTYEVTNLQLRSIEKPAIAQYIAPTLSGAWVNYTSGYNNAGYYKDPSGRVYLRGLIRSGSGTMFTLPVGFRPASRQLFSTIGNDVVARVDVLSDGTVTFVTGVAGGWVSLDGLSFAAEQ